MYMQMVRFRPKPSWYDKAKFGIFSKLVYIVQHALLIIIVFFSVCLQFIGGFLGMLLIIICTLFYLQLCGACTGKWRVYSMIYLLAAVCIIIMITGEKVNCLVIATIIINALRITKCIFFFEC